MVEVSQVEAVVQGLSPSEQKEVVISGLKNLKPSDQQDAIAAAVLPVPEPGTTNKIWLIVVIAFVIVFLCSFFAIAYIYIKPLADAAAAVDKLLLIFTTVTAFLAGLLAPSPVKK
ncbi:MAG TPA: hypothetical protein VF658_20800 [Pyrinomonadaceae bacterium]|jgi:uncharacterized membrane protein YhaH (DUF805 family)